MRRTFVLLLALAVPVGCSKGEARNVKKVIPLGQVPEVVMKAATTKRPDVKFERANKGTNGIYEVQGTGVGGKAVEVEVSEAGEVVQVE